MSNEILGDPRKALEEAFFARENAKLRQQLRDLDNTKRKRRSVQSLWQGMGDYLLAWSHEI